MVRLPEYLLPVSAFLLLGWVPGATSDQDHRRIVSSPARVAVVGAGIGGAIASALHQLSDDEVPINVTVFELGVVGGRVATVDMAGYTYEVGGSIIHPRNFLMKNIVSSLGTYNITKYRQSVFYCSL